jgi:hypothetical protein
VTRVLALPFLLLALHPFQASIRPLPKPLRAELTGRFWRAGCPVPLSRLRVLTVVHWGFDGRLHTGQLVVNEDAAAPLARVFRRLYQLRFPIRHLRLAEAYGPARAQPADGDISGAFECRRTRPGSPGLRPARRGRSHAGCFRTCPKLRFELNLTLEIPAGIGSMRTLCVDALRADESRK